MLALLLIFMVSSEAVSPIVNTTCGAVRGQVLKTSTSEYTFFAFQGIPYAQPPLGELRFKAPVKRKPWLEILNATQDGDMCLQIDGGSEDCLFLNVYTPSLPNEKFEGPFPVMVHIHGGMFIGGSGNFNTRRPDYFMEAEDKVVLVVIQYRLNVFGFLSTNGEVVEGNMGLKDQVAALQWIQENIAGFGGNPRRVTIFGQSAGAVSVQYLLLSPLAKGLFHQAIAESGSALNIWALQVMPRRNAFHLGASLGIYANSTRNLVEKLQYVNATKLLKAAIEVSNIYVFNTFLPVIEHSHPNAFITESVYRLLKNGNYATNIPYLTGYNENEAETFWGRKSDYYFELIVKMTPAKLIPRSMNSNKTDEKDIIKEIKSFYFSTDTFSNSMLNVVSDNCINRGIWKSVDLMKKFSRVYLYKFTYKTEDDPSVGHSKELQYLFKNESVQEDDNLKTMKYKMLKLWINFARFGDPTPVRDSNLNSVKWNEVTSSNEDIPFMNISSKLKLEYNVDKFNFNFWRQLFNKYGNPPYYTW